MKNHIFSKKNGAICFFDHNFIGFFNKTAKSFYSQLKRVLLVFCIFFFFGSISGQGLPSSNPPDLPQRSRSSNENAAPIGDGTFYLIGFAIAYIAVKIKQANKKEMLKKEINS